MSKGIQTKRSLTTYHWKICPKETKVLHLQLNAVQVIFKNTSTSSLECPSGVGGRGREGRGVEGVSERVRLSFYFQILLQCNSLCSQTSAQFIWRLNFAIEAARSSLPAKFFRRTIDLILLCWKLRSTLNG